MKVTQDLDLEVETRLEQEPSFGGSNLPRTMRLALKLRRLVEPDLDDSTKPLPFDDRVVAWLAPNLLREMIHFHGGKGKGLGDLFPASAITNLDKQFFTILGDRICGMHPEAIPTVNRFLRKRFR